MHNDNKMNSKIDHLVVGATTLRQGVKYVQTQLGVDIPPGGVHQKMGTHNHLMQLGEKLFLEVIAINPGIPRPARPRWFGLDDPHIRRSLAAEPRLLAWVVNTPDIASVLHRSQFCFGRAEPISRGKLSWLFGLPDDGRLLAGGLIPYIMQWHGLQHPAGAMQDRGCRFEALSLYHPEPDWLRTILEPIGINGQVQIKRLTDDETPYMIATIKTPGGLKLLSSEAPQLAHGELKE